MPDTDPAGGEERAVTEFGRLLHRYRQAAGLTQEELSERSGLSVRAISDMERGVARGPQRRSVDALADVLGLTSDALTRLQDAAQAGRGRSGSGAVAPAAASVTGLCELPPELDLLIGRDTELARLRQLADATATDQTHGGAVAVVTGQAGVGKTSLVVHAGYLLRPQFPDGAYFIDLRGVDDQPLGGQEALDRILRALGVRDAPLPRTVDELASFYRSLVRDRRMLLVLDNARDEAQVRPLLPGSSRGMVITTSRQALTGLDGAHRMHLEVLAHDAALRLLDVATGAGRVPAEQIAASEVAELCGHLPLALRIAGNRLAARSRWTIRFLADQLADQQRRLTLLTAGDRQVRAAFDVSYQQLSPTGRLVFRRMALVPGIDFGVAIAAVAADVTELEAIEALDELVDASMLLPAPQEGRHFFHDLLRLYARERLTAEETPDAVRAAEQDLADWLLSNVVVAGRFLDPDLADDPPRDTELADSAAALRWLDDEGGNWLPALTRAAEEGQHERVVAVTRALRDYPDARIDRYPWDNIFGLGVASARAVGSRRDEVALLNLLCWALWVCVARFEEALSVQAEALASAREIGDRREEGWALTCGAGIYRQLGSLAEAAEAGRGAVAAFQEIGFTPGEVLASGVLGNVLRSLGQLDEALAAHQSVLAYYGGPDTDEPSNLAGKGSALLQIGEDYAAMARWSEALDAFREVQELCARIGLRLIEGVALCGQARALVGLGRLEYARTLLLEAVEIFLECGDRWELANTELLIADTALDLGERAQAVIWWTRALRSCEQLPGNAAAADLAAELRQRLAAVGEAHASPPPAGAR